MSQSIITLFLHSGSINCSCYFYRSSGESTNNPDIITAFIHSVSPIKAAKRNPNNKYYNMVLQVSEQTYRGMSYNEDLRETLIKAEQDKSPMKLKNIKRKMNFFDNTKQDIELNNRTEICKADHVNFKYRKTMEDLCPQLSIATILQEKKDKDFISLVAFVSIDNRPVISTTLKYSLENINKKEVAFNDNTGVIKLTLWGTLIGVYEIINVKIREWPAGVLTITTTSSTTITPSSQKILPSKSSLKELM